MLIYSSHITLNPKHGTHDIFKQISNWLGSRCKSNIDPTRISEGVRELILDSGNYHITSKATLDENKKQIYPYLFCVQLSHGDDKVSGRRWLTEIGLKQESASSKIDCSFLLKTDEISALVTTPIQVTRPKIVENLILNCTPSLDTPGLAIKTLNENSARAFLMEIERHERRSPIVVLSPNRDGIYPVDPAKLQSQLLGIADIVQIAINSDTFKIEEKIGRRYSAFGGAVNIISPPRDAKPSLLCETFLFLPNDIAKLLAGGKKIESEILATVTHRTNLPYSWRHVSLDAVSQASLRTQLSQSIEKAKSNDESAEYIELLEEADRELYTKDKEVQDLRSELEDQSAENRRLQAIIDGLKHTLSGRQTSAVTNNEDLKVAYPLRDAISAFIRDEPSLEQSLIIVSVLFPDRVLILDSAFDSANQSAGFQYTKKAFELLWNLTNSYWEELNSGSDIKAKNVFGNNAYAQNEGDTLSNEGKKRRTFNYRGQDIMMLKHLKIGVKDSISETLRIHFEWLASEKKIIIGHCGKHLDV